ncbi:MAG: cytochrome b [Brevundimonas sp.]|uniref:cytochrome b n=1 Tax=Brevundimonas sp. TaxID=1871086 RepID=UPI000DB02781|nr:cytochrome b [Brevundimonas sp.]PZT96023.1 MAG: cytochrome b [Brevundimonas sp.]
MGEPRNRYSTVSLFLHWGIALAVLVQVLLIAAHENTEGPMSGQFVMLHKSLGLTILLLTLARIGWRLAHPAIALPAHLPPWQRLAARATHALFYVALIVIPMTGWLASSAGGREIAWFGLFDWPLLPIGGGRATARGFMAAHGLAVKGLYVLIALHVLAALKHQFVDRDNVLHRMIPLIPRRP